MKKTLANSFALILLVTQTEALDWPQWRGPERSGVSAETGILQTWPDGGPKLLWEGGAVGEGFSSLAITRGKIYTMGDKDGSSHLFALDQNGGRVLWSVKVGNPGGNYSGTRCTPTVDSGNVYAIGQFGDLVCVSESGRVTWKKNLAQEYGGKAGGWNFSESVLIDGNQLICSPGSDKASVVALDKRNGNEIWKTQLPGQREAHYSSWVISNAAGVKQYVRLFNGGTYGISASDGKFLWHYNTFGGNTANIPTPIPFDNYIFTAAGYGKGGALLQLSRSGSGVSAKEVYFSKELKNKHGGVIKIGNYIYGDFDDRGQPWCADVMTGNIAWKKERGAGGGSASITSADNRLFIRYQDSTMVLADASPEGGYQEISKFKIPDNMKQSWAHPVVSDGKLYLRGNDKILCYDIADPSRKSVAPAASSIPATPRLWKDNTGNFQIQATYQGIRGGFVLLQKEDGTVLQVPINRLSTEDQTLLRSL